MGIKKFFVCFASLIFVSGITLYYNHITKSQKQTIQKLKDENLKLNLELNNCKEENTHLVQQIQLQQEEYNKRVSQLLKKAQKPTKQVKVNPELPSDYEKIKDLIDKYIDEVRAKQ